jgi:flagellar biosynthetic protein FliR
LLDLFDISAMPVVLLIALRVSGIFLAGPVLSHWAIPLRLRLMMSLVIAWALAGRVPQPALPAGLADLVLAGVMELVLGLGIGFAAGLVFAGLEMAAGYISQQVGIGLIEALNGLADTEGDSIRRLTQMLWIVIFLAIGGHRQLLAALIGSFDATPLLTAGPGGMLDMVVGLLATSFALALRVAGPVVVTLLLVTIAMGLVQRTMPQMNTLSVGLSVTTMLGLLALAAATGIMMELMKPAWTLTTQQLTRWLHAAS